MIVDLLGWIASLAFSICAIPQAYQCYKQKHGKGINKLFMWIWLSGELLMMPYIIVKHNFDAPIMFNLITNTTFILVIMYYLYFPKETNAQI